MATEFLMFWAFFLDRDVVGLSWTGEFIPDGKELLRSKALLESSAELPGTDRCAGIPLLDLCTGLVHSLTRSSANKTMI